MLRTRSRQSICVSAEMTAADVTPISALCQVYLALRPECARMLTTSCPHESTHDSENGHRKSSARHRRDKDGDERSKRSDSTRRESKGKIAGAINPEGGGRTDKKSTVPETSTLHDRNGDQKRTADSNADQKRTADHSSAAKAGPMRRSRSRTDGAEAEAVTWKQDVTTKEQESQWKLLLADLRKGADLTSMVIPAQFVRPQSVLERLGFLMQHGRYLEGIVAPDLGPVERLKAVIAFHVSGLVREVFDGKKPYNPILGETCAWAWKHGDERAGVTRMVCEQVSHHPPISAMHIHNETLGLTMQGAAQIDAKFTGNSVLVPFKGERLLTIHALGEEYRLTYPSLQYRGVMLGPKGAEWIGKIEIRCAKTKLDAVLNFKPMGWLGMWGSWHRCLHMRACAITFGL